jgi:MYXO-CTERM domain-containing protein
LKPRSLEEPTSPSPVRSRRPRRSVAAFAAAAVLASLAQLVAASDAHAFCRTTTVPPDAGYDPATVGSCWPQGRPVAWPLGAQIGYELDESASTQVTLADFTTAADQAFTAWNTAACNFGPDGGGPNVFGFESGTVDAALVSTDCGLIQCGPTVHDTHHVITFRDSSWSSNDPVNTLALTIVTYGVTSGTIFDADIEINSAQHAISTANPLPATAYDLRSILTHETGHFFGLAHSQDTNAVMYAYYRPESIALTADDVAGICSIYVPSKGGGGGGKCAFTAGPATGHTPIVVGALALAAAFVRRRRRRSVP